MHPETRASHRTYKRPEPIGGPDQAIKVVNSIFPHGNNCLEVSNPACRRPTDRTLYLSLRNRPDVPSRIPAMCSRSRSLSTRTRLLSVIMIWLVSNSWICFVRFSLGTEAYASKIGSETCEKGPCPTLWRSAASRTSLVSSGSNPTACAIFPATCIAPTE